MWSKIRILVLTGLVGLGLTSLALEGRAGAQTAEGTQPSIAKRIGTVKPVSGSTFTWAPSAGPDVAVTVQPTARMLRLAPGKKDLKTATPIQVQDIQAGD